jgi:cytochrome c553
VRGAFLVVLVSLSALFLAMKVALDARAAGAPTGAAHTDPCPSDKQHAMPDALRLPTTVPPGEPTAIEQKMLAYLSTYEYRKLGWCVDKYVRDTGPYIHGEYYGTHPAVRIYYSPEMMDWLRSGRHGVPRDGAVMIKEQYSPTPAARYAGLKDDQLRPTDWTVMIRRNAASRDGWFWAEVFTPGMKFGGTQYPNAGFGLYCLRCHGSANDATTFASLSNIKGFAGDPITFKVDDSWRTPPPSPSPASASPVAQIDPEHEKNRVHPAIVSHAAPAAIQTFPAEPLDDRLANPHDQKPPLFMTSSQCMGCHSAASGPPSGPLMWLTPSPSYTPPPSPPPGPVGVNVSEYGEWRWSPMGLAGRDPAFFSQLEGELAYIASIPASRIAGDHPARTRAVLQQQVVDTCMRCHGVMGKRTNDIEHGRDAHFDLGWVFQANPSTPQFRLGGLARDGISCTVCHHITQTKQEAKSLAFVLENRSTGLFSVNRAEELHGPFETALIAAHPMNESLGTKPVFAAVTKSARLCTSCHSINLPVVDKPDKIHPITQTLTHDVEQNTYVEWVNSRFQTEYKPKAGAKSCQDCHMSGGVDNDRLNVHVPQIQTQIALVQDQTYPQSDHRAPLDGIDVRFRKKGFVRHELLGLNAFLLRTFQTNSDALGVRLNDYMSGSSTDLDDAIGNVVRQAQHKTATVDLTSRIDNGTLIASVGVTNDTGHRFPSGVGFRRAWIELKVSDMDGHVVWASGATNANGEIVDGADPAKILPTEYFTRGADGKQRYQKHFDERHPVTRGDQVQIFEELVKDHDGNFTESFIRRDSHVKDNRLLPQGWKKHGQPGIALPKNWLDATHPEGDYVVDDPNYANGEGRAVTAYRVPLRTALDPSQLRVEATLWYQSWTPQFRRERTSGTRPAATRFRVLLGNLQLANTAMKDWKLKIASASSP